LAGLRHAADALLEGGWQGVAALSFRRAWMQWFSGTVSMLDALDAMAAALGAAGADYALTEAAVRASVVRAE
jgi:WXG100 family type VII secretion target